MLEEAKAGGFPNVPNKLGAPTKKSLFERQKAEAEAKRQREQEETAAVYKDFVKSFDDDEDDAHHQHLATPARGKQGASAAFSKRHFSQTPTGPSSRGGYDGGRGNPGPGGLGPPPSSLARKPLAPNPPASAKKERMFAFDEDADEIAGPKTALSRSNYEDISKVEDALAPVVPKPMIRMTAIPPGTSTAEIKAILPPAFGIENVKILPSTAPGKISTDRRGITATIQLAQDTPVGDIDTAVNSLQDKYMGKGYYLSISRHLTSSSILQSGPGGAMSSALATLPFGATPATGYNMNRGPVSGGHRGGFAPPDSYTATQTNRGMPQLQVVVTPPSDLAQIKLIHHTLESLVKYGPPFEALLMACAEVQKDEKWTWLWDARSVGGVYYRWRLWELMTGQTKQRTRTNPVPAQQIFVNGAAWVPPEQKLQFEFNTSLPDLVSDSDYDSTDEDDSGDEGRQRYAAHNRGAMPSEQMSNEADSAAYLNPLHKAKLTHLLARLPDNSSKLRRGDVARITAFAIQHAGEGAEEVVRLIVLNILVPFVHTSAGARWRAVQRKIRSDDSESEDADVPELDAEKEDMDHSAAKLVALYVISDILSTSSTSGVRHAWRYRQLFENHLKRNGIFEHLGRLEKHQNWGRLRVEKWKRSINNLLHLWEGWCVFTQENQERFANEFNDPPLTADEVLKKKQTEEAEKNEAKSKARWKTVEANTDNSTWDHSGGTSNDMTHADGKARREESENGDLDGEAMIEDDDSDIDGVSMEPSDDEQTMTQNETARMEGTDENGDTNINVDSDRRKALAASIAAKLAKANTGPVASVLPPPADAPPSVIRKRQRPKAEDMFGSDEEQA